MMVEEDATTSTLLHRQNTETRRRCASMLVATVSMRGVQLPLADQAEGQERWRRERLSAEGMRDGRDEEDKDKCGTYPTLHTPHSTCTQAQFGSIEVSFLFFNKTNTFILRIGAALLKKPTLL